MVNSFRVSEHEQERCGEGKTETIYLPEEDFFPYLQLNVLLYRHAAESTIYSSLRCKASAPTDPHYLAQP